MKSVYFIIFLMLTIKSIGQTDPTVTISGIFNTDPNIAVGYVAAISDGTFTSANGWTRQPVVWTPTGPVVGTPPQGLSTSVIWQNTSNSPQKKIKVTVTYKKTGQTDKVVSDERVVTVKFLAPFTSLIFTGNVSQTNPANNGTITIPCNAGNITLAANQTAPITDPPATVAFTWTLPNGVTQTSSTGNITFNGSGTTDGAIIVTAKRMDGNFMQTFTVNFVRPRVTNAIINSINWTPDNKVLCSGDSRDLTGSATVNATVFSWTTTGGINITSAANQPTVTVSGTGNGTVTLSATNSCNNTSTRTWDVFAGTPLVYSNQVIVDGHPNYYPNYTNGSSYININGGGACQTYQWQVYGGSGYINPNYGCYQCGNTPNFTDCNAGSASTYSSMAVRIQTVNRCGQGNDIIIPLQINGGGGYYRMASPNPATNAISIDLVGTLAFNTLKH
jgi:PKD-like domain